MREAGDHSVAATPLVEVANGIWRVALPTPWPVGPVNAYLIDDEPLTLFDTGPIYAPAFAALTAALATRGWRVEDLERVIVSHQHPDHWGAGQRLAQRAGAELCALADFAVWLSDYPQSLLRDDRFATKLMQAHGLPDPAVDAAVHGPDVPFGEQALATRLLRDNDVLEFAGRRLRVLHRPGHSRSDTVLFDEASGVMLGADHVMTWPSVPMLSPSLDGTDGDGRPRAFADYLASLRATRAMDVETILPGHGETVDDPAAVIDQRLRLYERRNDQMLAAVDGEPRSALELAMRTRGAFAEASTFFVLCDALGYLDELLDAGAVVETACDGVVRFARR